MFVCEECLVLLLFFYYVIYYFSYHEKLKLLQETQRLMAEPVPGISAVPDDSNARYFHVVVAGKLFKLFKNHFKNGIKVFKS